MIHTLFVYHGQLVFYKYFPFFILLFGKKTYLIYNVSF